MVAIYNGIRFRKIVLHPAVQKQASIGIISTVKQVL